MSRNRRGFANTLLILALFIAACAHRPTDVANRYYAAEKFPPRDPSEVEVLQKKPARDFEVIADFQARNETLAGMRKRAADIGADAVIVTPLGGGVSSTAEWAGQSGSATLTRLAGTAIRYK